MKIIGLRLKHFVIKLDVIQDRCGRELSFEDILHYQKINVALTETERLMKEVDRVEFID